MPMDVFILGRSYANLSQVLGFDRSFSLKEFVGVKILTRLNARGKFTHKNLSPSKSVYNQTVGGKDFFLACWEKNATKL